MTPSNLELQVGRDAIYTEGDTRFHVTLSAKLPNDKWKVRINDPHHPIDGFEITVDASRLSWGEG